MQPTKQRLAKLSTGFEKVTLPTTPPATWSLFAMAAFRVLTGSLTTLPTSWTDEHARAAVADPAVSVVDRIEFIAYRELTGDDATADLMRLTPDMDEASRSVDLTLTGLACSLAAEPAAREGWIAAALRRRYRETEQVYLFETLALVRSDPGDLDASANAVALTVQSNLVRRDSVAVAPLVAALAVIARRVGTTAKSLLFDRLSVTDELWFRDDEPRFTCKGPHLEPVDDTRCELQLAIHGDGRFDAGADPAAPVTRFLSKNLENEIQRLSRRRQSGAMIGRALAGGTCTVRLRLDPTVAIDSSTADHLRQRVGIAWDCARHQLRGVGCRNELLIEQ